MSTQQLFLVCDSSTYANYSSWASAISGWFAACGWLQSTDTGQVMWSGMSLSAVSMSGSNATYTYSSLTGLALAVGRTLTIASMTNSGNNGTFRITALGSGTFTVVNASGVNESGSSGHVTAQSSVPGSGAFLYEVWQPGDSLQNYYVKMEYGNVSGANCPSLRISIASSTNGAGTISGLNFGPINVNGTSFTAPSSSTTYECDFSGDSGRMHIMMWRNGINSCQQMFSIERSLNSSGSSYGTSSTGYTTLWTCGVSAGNANFSQRSLVFGVGVTANPGNGAVADGGGWVICVPFQTSSSSTNTASFNGSIPIDLARPSVGFLDYSCTGAGAGCVLDFSEGVTFTATVYGSTRTYMPSKNGAFSFNPTNIEIANSVLCMRYD